MRLSLKLGILCAAAASIPLLIVSILILPQISGTARQQALEHLRSDARVAGSLYDKRSIELRATAQSLADEIANRALVSSDNPDRNTAAAWARMQDQIPRVQNEASLDFVIVTDPLGRVIARHNDKPAADETLMSTADRNPVAEKIIAGGNLPTATCVIERGERYAKLGLDSIARVTLPDGSSLDEALVVEAGAPIFSAGRFVGLVLIGQTLNTYYKPRSGSNPLQSPLIAEVRQAVSRGGEEDSGVLIALNKVIVASTIPPADNTKAPNGTAFTGTAHDSAKAEETLQQGDKSYSVAWQPLKTLDGSPIGAIGIARPSQELQGAANSVRTTLFLFGVLASLIAAGVGFLFGRGLGARVDDLREAAGRWSLGELSTPAKEREPFVARWVPIEYLRDEVNQLAEQLDQMREGFRHAIERIRKR